VKVAGDHDEFIALCRSAAWRPDTSAVERGLRMAAENSWDSIVARLEDHLQTALRKKRTARAIA
jgi:hypothetical protein